MWRLQFEIHFSHLLFQQPWDIHSCLHICSLMDDYFLFPSALRLLARRSQHFFQPSSNPFKTLPDYLESVVQQLAQEIPVSSSPCVTMGSPVTSCYHSNIHLMFACLLCHVLCTPQLYQSFKYRSVLTYITMVTCTC